MVVHLDLALHAAGLFVRTGETAKSGDNEVIAPGVVKSRTFLGEKVEYVVEVAGALLQAVTYDPTRRGVLDIGARVGVSCDASGVRPLAAE